MTIVAGFKVRDGILLCSDSQYTGSGKVFEQKIFPATITGDTYVFALAGHEHNGKMAIDECQEAIAELSAEKRTLRSVKRALKEAVTPVCNEYVLSRPASDQDYLGFEILVGCWIPRGGGHQMFAIARNGAIVRRDYDCIGTGSYLGHYFIRPAFSRQMSLEAVELIALQVLRIAKSYDPNCGGPSDLVIINRRGELTMPEDNSHLVESLLSSYEGRTRNLLLNLATTSEKEYRSYLAEFLSQLEQLRRAWVMMRPRQEDSPDPQHPTGGLSGQPPSPQSRGETDAS